MKIRQETVDLPEEQIIAFAQFLGWQNKVSDIGENGEQVFDEEGNPKMKEYSYVEFFNKRYGALPKADLKDFNLFQLRQQQEQDLKAAEEQVSATVEQLINTTVE
jgi:hypothetical protein